MLSDFSSIAKPLLDSLQDDPDRGPPDIKNPTNSPLDYYDAEVSVEPFKPLTGQVPEIEASDTENISSAKDIYPIGGLDMLAFYKSFRFVDMPPFRGNWGVFLIESGISAVSSELLDHTPALGVTEANRIAVELLYNHEHYHFWVDAWTLAQEYIPLKPRLKSYEYYLSYKSIVALDAFDFEESLANNYAFTRAKGTRSANQVSPNPALRAFLRNCPVPYSNFEFNKDQKKETEGVLASAIINGVSCVSQYVASSIGHSTSIQLLLSRSIRPDRRNYPLSDPKLCPSFVVRDPHYSARVQPYQMPAFKEFKKFFFNYLGAVFINKTDHEYYRIDNGEKVRFPNEHFKDIKKRELDNILFKAGMRYYDFCDARKKTKIWTKNCPRQEAVAPIG